VINIKSISLLLLIIFLQGFEFYFAQKHPDSVVHKLLTSGISNLISHEYDFAERDFKLLQKDYSKFPAGKFYLALLDVEKSNDLGYQVNQNKVDKLLDESEMLADKMIQNNENVAWAFYFKGMIVGFKAYHQAKDVNVLVAFTTGLRSVQHFEKCINVDKNLIDALGFIGTYKYWKSRKAEWIPFIKDEKEIGISYLKKAILSRSYNSYLARNSLIWIYIDQKDFSKALSLTKESLLFFPKSRLFIWNLARIYEEVNKEEAVNHYYKLLTAYGVNITKYNEIVLKHKIAQVYYKMGQFEKSLLLCNEILSIKKLNNFEKQELEERLNRVSELKESLSKK
jgi:tetratricopeptide (TPR) repeat protein